MDTKMEEKWIKHYSNHHKILLVGEGDFSFALSLANAFGSASNMVATSRDSKGIKKIILSNVILIFLIFFCNNFFECVECFLLGSLIMKYSRAFAILKELETLGCSIVHEVDAHSVHKHPMLQNKFFDRIVYNFPHAGFGLAENNSNQIWYVKKISLFGLKIIGNIVDSVHTKQKFVFKWTPCR
jgi:25S rRNA (uracil2634-N3)-methyltransferase